MNLASEAGFSVSTAAFLRSCAGSIACYPAARSSFRECAAHTVRVRRFQPQPHPVEAAVLQADDRRLHARMPALRYREVRTG